LGFHGEEMKESQCDKFKNVDERLVLLKLEFQRKEVRYNK
jgi:hypothetical protein